MIFARQLLWYFEGSLAAWVWCLPPILQVSKLDNDPASASAGPTRGALPRPAPAATAFRAFKRPDLNNSELTREDLEAAGQDDGSGTGQLKVLYTHGFRLAVFIHPILASGPQEKVATGDVRNQA